MSVTIYFVGTAGSGKTRLTDAFYLWMQQQGFDAITVNLDPGAEQIPYPVDVDIRDWIGLSEVMDKYGVGPNGAQIIAADLLVLNIGEVKEALEEFKSQYVLIDTPGQMELFTLRSSSKFVVETLGKNSLIAFLFDPALAKTVEGFVSLLLLSAMTQFRFDVPLANILAKADLLSRGELDEILSWSSNSMKLHEALLRRPAQAQLSFEFFKALEEIAAFKSMIPISSETMQGMEDLYTIAQQVFAGGEDLSKD